MKEAAKEARDESMQARLPALPGLELLTNGPHVIGATGGSGTRVLARLLQRGGVFIGTHLNISEDAIEFGAYSDRWINQFVTHSASVLEPEFEKQMTEDLRQVLERHGAPDQLRDFGPWGWKEPRSIYLLPFWGRLFPSLKFLHVVRDGRDMAYSSNQNQLNKHGRALLTWRERLLSRPLRSMLLWNRINLAAAEYGARQLPGRYLLIRFEDLCAQPEQQTQRVFDFVGLTGDTAMIAKQEVVTPNSLGRWREQDAKTLRQMQRLGEEALQRFGYVI